MPSNPPSPASFLKLILWLAIACPLSLGAAVITGFSESTVVSGLGGIPGPGGQTGGPSGMAVTPDGRVLVSNTNGVVQVVQNGVLVATPAITLSVLTGPGTDRGLISIAVDPNFASNGFVYMFYQSLNPGGTTFDSRLSRFTMTGNTIAAGSETVLKDFGPESVSDNIFHMGGGLAFGADGKLYVGIGDQLTPSALNISQNLGSYFGKVLRLNPDGTIPSDNPFVSTPGALGEIYATGFRNPFSLSIQPGTNRVLVNDVGEGTWEEINDLFAGGNYGWNLSEGPDANPNTIDPFYAYAHDFSLPFCHGAIVGGTYSASLASGFSANSYFFADYCAGTIRGIGISSSPVSSPLASNLGRLVATAAAPGGGLYYLSRSNGVLGVIEPVPEPASLLLVVSSLAYLGFRRKRTRVPPGTA